MNDDQITKAKTMRKDGATYDAISLALAVSLTTVYIALNKSYVEKRRIYRETHKEEAHIYYEIHKEEAKERSGEWHRNHEGYMEEWRENHKEHEQEYRKEHQAERAAHVARRRAIQATATAGSLDEIKEIYRQAREDEPIRCYLCGDLIPPGEREVDHVIPIIPNDPSIEPGKHAAPNLRIVHIRCNRRKNNKLLSELDWIK